MSLVVIGVLLASGVVVAFVVHLIVRFVNNVSQSKCFSNTHEGSFIHPDGSVSSSASVVGKQVTSGKAESNQSTGVSNQELLHLPASLKLSVVVPAYNEEKRIGAMLEETIQYLEKRREKDPKFTYEIVVVNDGSKDRTRDKVLEYSKKYGFEKLRLMNLKVNCGKGAAINKGIRHSRGELILFADADGASKFSDIEKLEKKLKDVIRNGLGCVVGSRYVAKDNSAERTAFRKFISLVFHTLVTLICGADIKDTQCGFKIFTRPSAQLVFPSQHVDRWAFDIDVLYLCTFFRIPVAETAITWQEIEGSKITVFGVIGMVRDILLIRLFYIFGVWFTKSKSS